MTTTITNRIMIYGPKDDGTYIIESRIADGEALAIGRAGRTDPRAQVFPGADALWAIRAGRSVRNLLRPYEFPRRSPHSVVANLQWAPETPPAMTARAGFSFWQTIVACRDGRERDG
jgi:hypothetical protein